MAGMNVFDLYASLSLNTDNYDSGLSQARNAADSFGADVADAIEAGVKAYTDLISESVKAYSNYEETADGIRRIFGETSDGIISNSKNAYKNAQMSSSEYLANAQVLSGALLRTLGDDTEEVTNLIDMAMTDLSDNVNAMGSDMNFVMKAYAGFARQEFKMLDNLYLGYGGTKTEARNLLYAMAEEKELLEQLGIEFKNLPETYDKTDFSMLTLDNIIKAIHVRQVQMNVAGTTLEEGATHIQGTIRKTQAAWKDLLKTFAGETDMTLDESIQHVFESVFGEKEGEGLVNVIVPRIAETMEGISKFIVKSAPILAETIPQVIKTIEPSLKSAIDSIGTLITTILPSVVDLLWPVVSDVMSTLLDNVTAKMHDSGGIFDLIANLIDFIRDNAEDLPGILTAMWGSITSLAIAQDIMEFITLLRSTFNTATLVVGAIGAIAAVLFLYRGELSQFFSQIGNYFEVLRLQVENIRDIFTNMDWGALGSFVGTELILGIANAINAGIGMISDAINNVVGQINIDFLGIHWNGAEWMQSLNEGKGFALPELNTSGLEDRAEEYRKQILNGQGEGEDVRKRIDARNEQMDALQKEMREGSWWGVGDERSMSQRATDTFGWLTNLAGFNTDLFKNLAVPTEVTESYNGLTETVATAANTIAGAEDSEATSLTTAIESTNTLFEGIAESSETAASALSDTLPTAATALTNALAGGEGGEGGGSLDSTLSQISKKLEEIYNNSTNIVNTWNGSLASAIKTLQKNAEIAVQALGEIGDAAKGAASGFDTLKGSIDAVVTSIEKLNKMEIQLPSLPGGGGLDLSNLPGRASGGPVTAGEPYWVGEAGPEVYIPQRSGTIVSNNNLGKLGQTVYVTVNFDGDVIGDEDSISNYVARACNEAIKEAVYAGA